MNAHTQLTIAYLAHNSAAQYQQQEYFKSRVEKKVDTNKTEDFLCSSPLFTMRLQFKNKAPERPCSPLARQTPGEPQALVMYPSRMRKS